MANDRQEASLEATGTLNELVQPTPVVAQVDTFPTQPTSPMG